VDNFAAGYSSECFSFIKDWVQKTIRRRMGRFRYRRGFGWKRWSRRWLHEEPTLFNGYRVRRAVVPSCRKRAQHVRAPDARVGASGTASTQSFADCIPR
jgi:hypothetical protein